MDILVGTFNTPHIYTLRFDPRTHSLSIVHKNPAIGSHSWLALSPSKHRLYATAWLDPPSVVAYEIKAEHTVTLLNSQPVASRSGYVTASATHLYSAGGPSGEAFALGGDGTIGPVLQALNFLDEKGSGKTEDRPHGDFGGLRHGAHSVDLSPDGSRLYVADIGRNCVWTFNVNDKITTAGEEAHLTEQTRCNAPRDGDGPRHTIPHPNGKVLYSVQEHSSVVDVLQIHGDGKQEATTLTHSTGLSILPSDKDAKDFWADEVRISHLHPATSYPTHLWASTRGLQADTKGYVSILPLDASGDFKETRAGCIWQTPTSGGIANAIEPAPVPVDGIEYAALTDSEQGMVMILAWDGREVNEVARVKLESAEGDQEVIKAATAVWL